ncbi:hypothetical protein [Thiothrix eikelboomii]|uniref:hypothetical protein n=1 Tax=Thiothrix eikelboomii TaxID=92487 RepID=UPI003BAE2F1C
MKNVLLLLVLFCSILLSACQDSTNEKQPIEKVQLLLPQAGFLMNPAATVVDNKLVLLLGEKRGVVFYEVGKEQVLSEDASSKQWLHYDGKTLYAIWWAIDAQKAKTLKVRTSNDGGITFSPVSTINTETGVLADISFASNGQGAIAIAYTDERRPGYGVYLNYSTDSGKTWASQDSRIDTPVVTEAMKAQNNQDPATFANSPKLSYLGDKLIVIWQQLDMTEMGQSMLRIVSKSSSDYGKTWGAESNLFTAPNMQPVELTTFSNANEIYAFAMLNEQDKKGFFGFYNTTASADQWAEVDPASLEVDFSKRLFSWIKGTFSGDNLVLAFISEPNEGGSGKVHAATATLSTKTHQWLGPIKLLDADKGHDLSKSTYPNIINTGKELLLVWEDYRSIVPSLYASVSKDHGQTWLSTSFPLTTPGLSVAKDPKLYLGKDKLWLTYFMVELNGKNPSGTRVYQELVKDSNGQFLLPDIKSELPDSDELKERLIERVNKFWALREERKWEETWNYMEPVYRERFDKAQWLAQQGKLSFSKAVVDESTIDIKNNFAVLDANVEVSVNQQVAKEGLLESAPPNQQKVEMKWGWFYDDWYFMPDIIFGNHLEY